jgi:hypothetical protein
MDSFAQPESDQEFKGTVGSEGIKHSRHVSPFSDKTEKLSYEQGGFDGIET